MGLKKERLYIRMKKGMLCKSTGSKSLHSGGISGVEETGVANITRCMMDIFPDQHHG
jgi:hypothetical protein